MTTAIGITGRWRAILADTGATGLVTANAMQLFGWKGSDLAGLKGKSYYRYPWRNMRPVNKKKSFLVAIPCRAEGQSPPLMVGVRWKQ